MSFTEQIEIEFVKTALSAAVSVGVLLLTWFGGQWILAQWDTRKKRKELDIQTAQRFHELIGEWKAVWRAWKIVESSLPDSVTRRPPHPIAPPIDARWELLNRAAKAEGGVEAIVLRLALERELCDCEREDLGLFRQSFQQLREAIRDAEPLAWSRTTPEYWLSHELSVRVSAIIDKEPPKEPLSATDGAKQFQEILKIDKPKWRDAVLARTPQVA